MPSDYWFTQALMGTILVYLLLALYVVIARIRFDRRSIVFARIAKQVEAGQPASSDRPARFWQWLNRARLRVIESGLADLPAPVPVMQACAVYVVAQVGESALQARASHGRRWKRIAALRTLAFAGADSAWPLLSRAIDDDDPVVRRAAVVTLGHVHERRSAELLIKALRRPRQRRSHIAAFLEAWPSDISDLLWPLLTDPDYLLRYWGAALAGRCRSAEGVARHLIPATRDPEPSVRKAALDSLAATGCTEAVPMALALLDDPVPYVRAHAAQALGQIGSVEVAPNLAAKLGDPDWPTQRAAKRALEHLGRAVEAVVIEHLFDDNDLSRTGAAEVLQNLGTIERLLSQETREPSDPKRRLWLSKLAEAGGVRVQGAVLANLPVAAQARVAGRGDRLEHAGAVGTVDPDR